MHFIESGITKWNVEVFNHFIFSHAEIGGGMFLRLFTQNKQGNLFFVKRHTEPGLQFHQKKIRTFYDICLKIGSKCPELIGTRKEKVQDKWFFFQSMSWILAETEALLQQKLQSFEPERSKYWIPNHKLPRYLSRKSTVIFYTHKKSRKLKDRLVI